MSQLLVLITVVVTLTGCSLGQPSTVQVGVLNAQTGTMAISESAVVDATLLAIEEINAQGGVLGRRVVPIVEDTASQTALAADKSKKLIEDDQVAAIFGCWTSACRKAVLPVVEFLNSQLWCPGPSEGLEFSPNIFYTGAGVDQQVIPAVSYLIASGKTRFFLLGTDVFGPRIAGIIVQSQIAAQSRAQVVAEEYVPIGSNDFSEIIPRIRASNPDVVLNTLNGQSNAAFFEQLRVTQLEATQQLDNALDPDRVSVLSVRITEEAIRNIGPQLVAGQLVAWNYFQSTETPANQKFVAAYKARYGDDRVTGDSLESAYVAVHLWKMAVEKAGSFEPAAVRRAAAGLELNAPEGLVRMDGQNHHMARTARIGVVQPNGQIEEVWSSAAPIEPDPFLGGYPWAAGIRRPSSSLLGG